MIESDVVLGDIRRYVLENYPDNMDANNPTFQEQSYRIWAAGEIANRIMDKPHDDPVIIMDRFMLEMLFHAKHHPENLAFQTAYRTAEKLISIYL